jgi:predicted nucleic acid-binding protein
MRVVVAETSPINYLILIDKVDVLRRLYAHIVIPEDVLSELGADGAPPQVSAWIHALSEWVEVRSAMSTTPLQLQVGMDDLDAGEIAAISWHLAKG